MRPSWLPLLVGTALGGGPGGWAPQVHREPVAAVPTLRTAPLKDNVCQKEGYPCFTPNPKDVNASSLLATCGPVYGGIFSCQDLQAEGRKCFYNYPMYTCDQGHDPPHDHESGEECLQGSFDDCNSLCLKLDKTYKLPCTNFCKRACKIA